jgi:tRNA/rRNA methyltransferase
MTESERGPAIILVGPQLGENIGAAARAMANFGLTDLRIVAPRDGWPNEKARANASGAIDVVDAARVFDRLEDAVGDLAFVAAATARQREVSKAVRGPEEVAGAMRLLSRAGAGTGILFGRERFGLSNEEVSVADEIVTFPVDPQHASLNVAQAVLLVAYEWRRSGLASESEGLPFDGGDLPAAKEDMLHLFDHLERALDAASFFRPPEKKPHMVQALRTLLSRAGFTEQEVRTLRGVIAALEGRPTRPRKDGG